MRIAHGIPALALIVAACGSTAPTAAPARTLGPSEYLLPASATLVLGPNETAMACAGIGADAFLRGSAADPRHAWIVDATSGARSELVWPTGSIARFAPALEVLDAQGRTQWRDGDHITGLCVTAGESTYWLPPAQ